MNPNKTNNTTDGVYIEITIVKMNFQIKEGAW